MTGQKSKPGFREEKVSIRIKIICLWISVMFCYIYADIKAFYETGYISQIISGNLSGLIVNQEFLFYSALLMSLPPILIVLTLILKPSITRIINIVFAIAHIILAISILFASEEIWAYFYLFTTLEVIILALIAFYSIRWSKEPTA